MVGIDGEHRLEQSSSRLVGTALSLRQAETDEILDPTGRGSNPLSVAIGSLPGLDFKKQVSLQSKGSLMVWNPAEDIIDRTIGLIQPT